jgi:hypothetical protein
MQCAHPNDLGYVNRICDESFVERLEHKMRYRMLRSDGQYRWTHSHGIPKFAVDGTFNGYIGTIVDVHEQKLRQEELKKHVWDRTQELRIAVEKLRRTNRQLEEFAYLANHDLQEPLRETNPLTSLLTQRHAS